MIFDKLFKTQKSKVKETFEREIEKERARRRSLFFDFDIEEHQKLGLQRDVVQLYKALRSCPITEDFYLDAARIVYGREYPESYLHTRFDFEPYTPGGKISKYPCRASITIESQVSDLNHLATIYYAPDDTIGKAEVSYNIGRVCYSISIRQKDGQLAITKVIRTQSGEYTRLL